MNKSLPLEESRPTLNELRPDCDVIESNDQPRPKKDMLKIMWRVDKALEGLSAKERNLVLEYLKRNEP